jgi:hypothetical protein
MDSQYPPRLGLFSRDLKFMLLPPRALGIPPVLFNQDEWGQPEDVKV